MVTKNFYFQSNGKNLDSKFIEERTIDLLRNKGDLTFSEITRELNIENGDREILLNILQRMAIEKRIKKEKIKILTDEGINLTTRFFL